MVIVGYQGIGKSTIAGKNNCIDLESGNMFVEGIRADNWYIPYCQMAIHLSEQGYTVFTSSHKVVRDELKKSKEVVAYCYPSLELKDFWIRRLEDRYEKSKLGKDYKALMNAKDCYEKNIEELMSSLFVGHIEIKEEDYSLYELIEDYRNY